MRMKLGAEEPVELKRSKAKLHSLVVEAGGLDQILVKHKSRLEREKAAAAQQPEDETRFSVTRKQARERELQEQWGGLGLGNSMKPHQSKLELDELNFLYGLTFALDVLLAMLCDIVLIVGISMLCRLLGLKLNKRKRGKLWDSQVKRGRI